MADKYVNLAKTTSGAGTQGDPYSPSDLTSYLASLTTLAEDLNILLYGGLIITDGAQIDWTTPLLVTDNGYEITFKWETNESDGPNIYSDSGNFTGTSLVKIGGGNAKTNYTDTLIHVNGSLNGKLICLLEVTGNNEVIVSNTGEVVNNASNFNDIGGMCNPVCAACGVNLGYTPILQNDNTAIQSNTLVTHAASPQLLDFPSFMQPVATYANNQVILGNVAYTEMVDTDTATKAEANHFHKVSGTTVSVVSIYATSVLTPEGQADVGTFADDNGLINVIGDIYSIDLDYDPVGGVGKGLANIANTSTFDDNYTDFSLFTNTEGNAGYNLVPEVLVNKKELPADIYVKSLNIAFGSIVISSDHQNVEINYTGTGDPSTMAVFLLKYQYSTDNGSTWTTMSATVDTDLTGLTFTPTGNALIFKWKAKEALGSDLYNNLILLKMQAQNGTDVTAEILRSVAFEREQSEQQTARNSSSPFPDDYSGVGVSDLLKNAPKS